MGGGRWTSKDWSTYAGVHIRGKSSASAVYTSRGIDRDFDPRHITFRESCDSTEHPDSTPIIIGLDVTGSMSRVLMAVAERLGFLVEEIYSREPVADPQIMFQAIGDAMCDRAPLQATQFESDIRIAEQLTRLWFEQGGGGNGFESYPLSWWFAAHHTQIDSFDKRGRKGFLFTMGDDCYPDVLTKEELDRFLGDQVRRNVSVEEVLQQANRKYEVFHLMLEEGGSARQMRPDKWRDLLGERAISVSDYTRIPEIIVSILETMGGKPVEDVVKSWDGSTSVVVRQAIAGLSGFRADNGFISF